jgi:hypothetical protein
MIKGLFLFFSAAAVMFTAAMVNSPQIPAGPWVLWELNPPAVDAREMLCDQEYLFLFQRNGMVDKRSLSGGGLIRQFKMGIAPASAPALSASLLLATGKDGCLYALEKETGRLAWRQNISWSGVSDLSVGPQGVYVAGGRDSSEILGFRLDDGSKIFALPLDAHVVSAPAIDRGFLYAGTTSGRLYAVDMSRACITDTLFTEGEFYRQRIVPFQGSLLISPSGQEKRVLCLKSRTGVTQPPLWSLSFARAVYPDADELHRISMLRPEIRDRLLREYLAKMNLENSRLDTAFLPAGPVHTSSWTVRGNEAAVVLKEPDCFARAQYRVLLVNLVTGSLLLQYERILDDVPLSYCVEPILTNQSIIVVFGKGTLLSINKSTQKVEWEYTLAAGTQKQPLLTDNSLILLRGDGGVTALEKGYFQEPPEEYALDQNIPNPFNPQTNIRFQLPMAAKVSLAIFNPAGRRILSLLDGEKPAGFYKVAWNGKDNKGRELPSGIYFAVLKAGKFKKTITMTLLK